MLFFQKYTYYFGDLNRLYGKTIDFSELEETWEDIQYNHSIL